MQTCHEELRTAFSIFLVKFFLFLFPFDILSPSLISPLSKSLRTGPQVGAGTTGGGSHGMPSSFSRSCRTTMMFPSATQCQRPGLRREHSTLVAQEYARASGEKNSPQDGLPKLKAFFFLFFFCPQKECFPFSIHNANVCWVVVLS